MSLQTKFPQNMKKCSSKKDKYPKQQSEYKTMKYKEHLIEWRMSKLKKERLGYERVFKYLEDYMAKEDLNLNFMWFQGQPPSAATLPMKPFLIIRSMWKWNKLLVEGECLGTLLVDLKSNIYKDSFIKKV